MLNTSEARTRRLWNAYGKQKSLTCMDRTAKAKFEVWSPGETTPGSIATRAGVQKRRLALTR